MENTEALHRAAHSILMAQKFFGKIQKITEEDLARTINELKATVERVKQGSTSKADLTLVYGQSFFNDDWLSDEQLAVLGLETA